MQITQLWQYPVKSMIGVTLSEATLGSNGMEGDRAWAVRDEVRGGIRGAKKIGDLMRLAARYPGAGFDTVEIVLPDGEVVSSAQPDANERITAALSHHVTLWPLRPAEELDHYRRGKPDHDDPVAELREIFGRDADEPFPDFSLLPPVVFEYESPPGTYHDVHPLLLMTTSALQALENALPDSVIDVRRFRPNVVIDSGDQVGHPEFSWIGRQIRLGEVTLDVAMGCPRCVMVTREVTPNIPADRAVLRHVVRELDQNVGVYATVTTPGVVRTGDSVTVI